MEAGLHVTLYSLSKNYSRKNTGLKIYLFLDGFSERDTALLRATLDHAGTSYELHFGSVDLDSFDGFFSLFGSSMPYARIMLADILKSENKFLYLDSDLLVGVDVHDLFQTDLQNELLGAVVGGTIEWSLEKEFFLAHKFRKDDPYFNSGVLLFNGARWRDEKLMEECFALCKKYPDQLKCQDQTVLNYICNKKVLALDKCYNVPSYASGNSIRGEPARCQITHFLGSPKPWDMFGSILHPGYRHFKNYFDQTALSGKIRVQPQSFYRAFKLRRSYFRCISAKYKSRIPRQLQP